KPMTIAGLTMSGFAPVFLIVTVLFPEVVFILWAGKAAEVADRVVVVGSGAPVPERATDAGLPAAFEAIDSSAVLVSVALGVNVTETVQLPPAATVVQVLVCANWSGFVPPSVTPLTTRLALPVFDTVTVCGALVVPVFWLPNARGADSETTGAGTAAPVPVSG